jgi:hypothetical protein
VRVVETGVDTGIFAGSIKVASSGGTTEFSQIQAAEGDTLTISYIDEVNTTGSSRSVTDTASVTIAVTPTPVVSPTPGVTPTPTVTPTFGNIAGQVTDSVTGAGINGATVTLDTGESATTGTQAGRDGIYAIQGVSVGSHDITAAALTYASSTQTVTVVEGNPNPQTFANIFNFALVSTITPVPSPTPTPATTGNLGGQITDAVTGAGIVGATVTLEETGDTTTTIANGAYAFQDLAPGDYTVTASADNYLTASAAGTVVAGQNTIVTIALQPTTGNLAGQVTDATTGDGIVGATVTADGQTTTTITGGAYAFQGIAAGDYTVTASATGYISGSQAATVTGGETIRVDFALVPGVATPTPVASPTPTPPPCVPVELDAAPEPLKLLREASASETVTVTCGDGSASDNRLVTATVKSGKKRIVVSPPSALTDANGQAQFTITATKKTGNAKVKFQDAARSDVKDTITVKVRKK